MTANPRVIVLCEAVVPSAAGDYVRLYIPSWCDEETTVMVPIARFSVDERALLLPGEHLTAIVNIDALCPNDLQITEVRCEATTCAICDKKYSRAIGPTQAPDCASMVRQGSDGKLYLTGHYESDFDCRAYAVISPPAESPVSMPLEERDPICDACVRGYAAAGMLHYLGNYMEDTAIADRVFPG